MRWRFASIMNASNIPVDGFGDVQQLLDTVTICVSCGMENILGCELEHGLIILGMLKC